MTVTKLFRSVVLALALVGAAPLLGNWAGPFAATNAQAQTVSQIAVTGNVRVDEATVRSFLTVRPGEQATPAALQSSRDALNASGLFERVTVGMAGNTLQVQVVERSSVASVGFEGNQRFSAAQLTAMVDVATRGVYTQEGINADIRTIQAAYDQAGYSNVTVTASAEPTADGRLRVIFRVNEGDRAGIAAINFTGNNSISSGTLRSVIRTNESHLLSWLFRDDIYDEDRLAVDRELVRIYYANRGFPDARVLSSVAEFDASRNAYFINFTIDEGERYEFGNVAIETSIDGLDVNSLRGAIRTREGTRYAVDELQTSTQDLALRATLQGEPFAEVRPRIDRDIANRRFNITYLVDEGPRVYVERINITGNTRTRDFVIRREFDFAEGDPFNRSLVTRGRERIEELGFFSSVNVTAAPGSAPDRVVINVAVVEQSTGEYGIGAGYSSEDGILGEISISERNFLGRGQYVRAAVGASESGRTFDFSFTEPRFMGLRVSAGVDVYRRIRDEGEGWNLPSFGTESTGGQLRLGLPIIDHVTLNTFVGYEQTRFTDARRQTDASGNPIPEGDSNFGLNAPAYIGDGQVLDKLTVGYSLNYSDVDNTRRPTRGLVASFSQSYIGLSHDLVRTDVRARYYHPIWEEHGVIGSVRGQAGTVHDLGGSGVHPTEAFRVGPTLVRGFQPGGMGNRSSRSNDPFGVLSYAGLSAEIELPVPMLPESWGIRAAVWGDAAWIDGTPNVAGEGQVGLGDPFKSSVGASLIWDSPFGPLRGDFAHVISKDSHDRTQLFQLSLSTLF